MMDERDERRIMKFLKVGMRAWEKETHPVPGPEITYNTLIVLKMLNVIDKDVDTNDDKIETIRQLLILNNKINKNKRKSK